MTTKPDTAALELQLASMARKCTYEYCDHENPSWLMNSGGAVFSPGKCISGVVALNEDWRKDCEGHKDKRRTYSRLPHVCVMKQPGSPAQCQCGMTSRDECNGLGWFPNVTWDTVMAWIHSKVWTVRFNPVDNVVGVCQISEATTQKGIAEAQAFTHWEALLRAALAGIAAMNAEAKS